MHNDILDEIEKHTGPRSCPDCGYQLPFGEFVRRYVLSYGLSKWPCQGCRVLLTCDYSKIQMISLLGLLVAGVLFGLSAFYFDLGLFNVVYMLPYFAFVLYLLFYVKFEKYKTEE